MSSPAAAQPSLPARGFNASLGLVRHMLPPTLFFFAGFNLILWTMHLALARHGIEIEGFLTATVAALLAGKAVLLTDKLPFMARFDGAPLIQPILFKSTIYWACAFLVRLADILVHFAIRHRTLKGFMAYAIENFDWRRFTAIQVWLMVLLLLYVILHELNTLFGDGELYRLFFRWRSSQAKLTRRSRIRLLVRLNRLTENNPISAMSDRSSPANGELVSILQALARSPGAG